jgi:hypothetical protein
MEENFKKVEAKFKFSKAWTDTTDNTQEVNVDLIINYHNKTFSVTPVNQSSGKFTFCKGNSNSIKMWISVLDAIKEATYFAHKELGF